MFYYAKWTLLSIFLYLYANYAWAAITTTTLPVSLTVNGTCDTLTATTLAFGNYDPTASSVTDSTNSISVRCTLSSAYTISLNRGTTSSGTIAQRQMMNSSNRLNYNLYTTSGRTIIWGDGITGSTVAGSGTGLLQTYTVYGRIPANQVTLAGSYSDTITVTVTY